MVEGYVCLCESPPRACPCPSSNETLKLSIEATSGRLRNAIIGTVTDRQPSALGSPNIRSERKFYFISVLVLESDKAFRHQTLTADSERYIGISRQAYALQRCPPPTVEPPAV